MEEQECFLDKFGNVKRMIPYNSDNRRNIGFLMALERGCEGLIWVDDDNYADPLEPFFKEHLVVNQKVAQQAVNSNNGWLNVCELMDVEPRSTCARGFPYRCRHKKPEVVVKTGGGTVHINAGLLARSP